MNLGTLRKIRRDSSRHGGSAIPTYHEIGIRIRIYVGISFFENLLPPSTMHNANPRLLEATPRPLAMLFRS